MTIEQKKEIISAIIAMWHMITNQPQAEQRFYEELLVSSEQKLAVIFFEYIEILKRNQIERINSMIVSWSTYQAAEKAINQKIKTSKNQENDKQFINFKNSEAKVPTKFQIILNEENQSMIKMLGNLKNTDFQPATAPESLTYPFFNLEALKRIEEESLDMVVALTLYFLSMKENQEATTCKELGLPMPKTRWNIPELINTYFPCHSDFYRYIKEQIGNRDWENKSIEACFEDLKNILFIVLYCPPEPQKKRSVARI